MTPTGQPREYGSFAQSNSLKSLMSAAFGPNILTSPSRHAFLRSSTERGVHFRASVPPMNPRITPGLPSFGDASKVTLIGPMFEMHWPERFLSRQNGFA